MSKFGKFSAADLKKLQKQLNELQDGRVNAFIEACAKELAARLLSAVIKRTPVGSYTREVEVVEKRNSKNHKKGDTYTKRMNPSGKSGGTLRRGWTSKTQSEAEKGGEASDAAQYVKSLEIQKSGGIYTIEIVNPVEYASYVEYGHRQEPGRYVPAIGKSLKKSWVKGKFMLTISEIELQAIAPNVLEAKIKSFLGGVFS